MHDIATLGEGIRRHEMDRGLMGDLKVLPSLDEDNIDPHKGRLEEDLDGLREALQSVGAYKVWSIHPFVGLVLIGSNGFRI